MLCSLALPGLRHAAIAAAEHVSLTSLLARAGSLQALQHCCAGTASSPQASTSYSTTSAAAAQQQNNLHRSIWSHLNTATHLHMQQQHPTASEFSHHVRGFTSSASSGSQCDCPTLGGPTPDIVTVEYDEEEVDRFIALADAIEEAFPNIVVEGNPSGPGRPGAFEVTGANGALLFSKLSSGGWPQAEVVVDAVGAAAAACSLPAQQQ